MSIRCFIPDGDFAQETIALPPDAAHHVARVLRVQPGDALQLFDGRGQVADAEVTEAGKRSVSVRITSRQTVAPLTPEVTVVQALIRPQAMDQVMRKATELGASAVQPVLTDRCVARTRERPERWMKTVIAAAEQCGSAWLPVVGEVQSWSVFLARLSQYDGCVLCSLAAQAEPLKAVLAEWPKARRLAVLVGPEGDFTPEEAAAALRAGARAASLGPLVLRAETAPLAALAAVRYAYS